MAFGFTATAGTITGTHSGFVGLFVTANFPAGSLSGANAILNGGGNLRAYTDSTKSTALPLEIVTLVTGGSSEAGVWVRSNSLSTSGTVYFEADDTATTQPAVTAPLGRNAVWSDYDHVYHCHDSNYTDSTGNSNLSLQGSTAPTIVTLSNGRNAYRFTSADSTALVTTSNISYSLPLTLQSSGAISQLSTSQQIGSSISTLTGTGGYDIASSVYSSGTRFEPRGRYPQNQELNPPTTAHVGQVGDLFYTNILWDGAGLLTLNGSCEGNEEKRTDIVGTRTLISNGQPYNKIGIGAAIDTSPIYSTIDVQEARFSSIALSTDRVDTEYDNQNSPSTFWTSSAWAEQATGITVTGATASYVYNGVLGTIELTGEIVVTGSTASYAYNGVNGDIDLASEILITGQTAYYSYVGLSGSVDLSGLISVTGQTASYDYDGVSGEVILQGTIVVTGDTANYAYNALNGTIIIQGPITVNPKNVITVKRKSNDIIVSRKSNTVRVK